MTVINAKGLQGKVKKRKNLHGPNAAIGPPGQVDPYGSTMPPGGGVPHQGLPPKNKPHGFPGGYGGPGPTGSGLGGGLATGGGQGPGGITPPHFSGGMGTGEYKGGKVGQLDLGGYGGGGGKVKQGGGYGGTSGGRPSVRPPNSIGGMPGGGVPGDTAAGDGRRAGVTPAWIKKQMKGYSGGPDAAGSNANWSLNENQMKTLANQMAEGGLGRKGINWMFDNKAYMGALGGGVDAKSDRAFNANLTPEQMRWMMQAPGFSGGLNDSKNMLQGDLFQQFPELIDAYLGGMGKMVGFDDRVANIGPDGRPYSAASGYGMYQSQGGQSTKDQWIAAQQDAYARHQAAYEQNQKTGYGGSSAGGDGTGGGSVRPNTNVQGGDYGSGEWSPYGGISPEQLRQFGYTDGEEPWWMMGRR